VADDLVVRTLALQQEGGRPFVLSVCDLIGMVREDTLAIRRAVDDVGADVVIASTHTHSGPDTIGLWGPEPATRGVDEDHLAAVRGAAESSIRAAFAALRPAVVRVATTTVHGVIENFRDPEILDEQVGVLALDRPDGSAIATLVNAPVHPEVLDGDSTLISPDMAGACCRAVERVRGGVGIWASADLGGMQSPATGPRTTAEVERKGVLVADAALDAIGRSTPLDDPAVRFRGAEVDLPMWNPMFRMGLKAGILRGALREDGGITTDVGVLDIGPARMAFWPGEVLPELGMASKLRLDSPYPFLIGLANDELGYILPPDQFKEPADWEDPGERYEESMSVGPETASRLQAAIDQLLD